MERVFHSSTMTAVAPSVASHHPSVRYLVILLVLVLAVLIVDELAFVPKIGDALVALQEASTIPALRACPNRTAVAIVLFGIPKEFAHVWNAYETNIVHRNPHVDFSVTLHVFDDVTVLTNPKNHEIDAVIESVDSLQQVLKAYHPHIVTSKQDEFDQTLSWLTDDHVEGRFDQPPWNVDTLKNMFRQGHSIEAAFRASMQRYRQTQTVIFVRSDTLLLRPIDVPCMGLPRNKIQLPSWQVHNRDEHVDRLAIAGIDAATIYSRAKTDAFTKYVQRGDVRAVLRNSEHMLKMWLDEQIGLDVAVMPKAWAPLLRVRAGAKLSTRDYKTHLNPLWLTRILLLLLVGGTWLILWPFWSGRIQLSTPRWWTRLRNGNGSAKPHVEQDNIHRETRQLLDTSAFTNDLPQAPEVASVSPSSSLVGNGRRRHGP